MAASRRAAGSSRKTIGRSELSESSKSEAVAGFGARAEVGGIFPGGFFVAAGLIGRRDGPFGERKQRGADDGRDRALGARVEFADGFDGVAEEFDADGARRFGGEDVDDAAADGELAGEFDHFGAGVADGAEMEEEFVERSFDVAWRGCERGRGRRRDPGSARGRRRWGRSTREIWPSARRKSVAARRSRMSA